MIRRKPKWLKLILIVSLAVALPAGTVLAYLSATSQSVDNSFTASPQTQPDIVEQFEDGFKRDVAVNVGNPGYAVYVRVAIIASWQTSDGAKVHWQIPTLDEYVLNWNSTDWFYNQHDGYYYLKQMVSSGNTPNLINLCYQTKPGPLPGYQLHIELVAQTIQAVGTTDGTDIPAVTDAWGIRVDGNGQLYNSVVAAADDNWENLAIAYGVYADALAALNGKKTSDEIVVGQTIILPNLP